MNEVQIETTERKTQTFTAPPLVVRREYRSGRQGEPPIDEVRVMLQGTTAGSRARQPKVTAEDLRRMAAACTAAARAIDPGGASR